MGRIARALFQSVLFLTLTSNLGQAKLPDDVYLDDAFAWFEAETHYKHEGGKRFDGGFSLKCELRIHGSVPARSALKLVVKQDGDEVATIRNEMLVYNPDPARRELGAPVAHAYRCGQEDKQIIQGTGEFEIDVYVIDGSSLEENFAKTYTIDVQTVQRAGGGTLEGNIPAQDAPEYFVSRHGEVLSSVIHLIRPGFTSFESKNPETNQNDNGIEIIYNVSGPSDKQPGSEAFFRCSVDDKPITLGKDGRKRADQATSRSMREIVAIHSDRNAMKYRNIAYQEEISFRQRVISVPLTFGAEDKRAFGLTALEDHPGEWSCSLVQNGKTIRTFRWEVSADGPIVPHPEHEEGLRIGPNTFFIETEIPEGGSYTDARIVADAAAKTGFFGHRWGSRSAKRMAKKLEDVGNAFPVASAAKVEMDESVTVDTGASEAKAKAEQEAADKRAAEEEAAAKAEAERQEALEKEAEARVAEQEAEIERLRAAGQAEALAEAEADLKEAQAALASAQSRARDAANDVRGRGGLHLIVGSLLAIALLAVGVSLAGGSIPALASVVQALAPHATLLGLATIGLALLDFVFDLMSLRPLIGDGIPQLLALAGGVLLWRSAPQTAVPDVAAKAAAKASEALERHGDKIENLKAYSIPLGFACIAAGVLHLVSGGSPFI